MSTYAAAGDGITYSAALTELGKLGHDYVEADRLPRFLLQAARDLLLEEKWLPRLVDQVPDATGKIAGLGQIQSVRRTDAVVRALEFVEYDDLVNRYGTLTAITGDPNCYTVPSFEVVNVFPAGLALTNLVVKHFTRCAWRDSAALEPKRTPANTDTFTLGAEFDDALLLRARVLVLEDTDEAALRDSYDGRYERALDNLREEMLSHNADLPAQIQQTEGWA